MVHRLHLKSGNNFCSENFLVSMNMNNIMNQKKKMVGMILQNQLYRLIPVFAHETLSTKHNILCRIRERIRFRIISNYHAILLTHISSK